MRIFILGAGEVGFHIASSLVHEGHDLVVIEQDAERVQRLQSELDVMAVHGDGCQPLLLQQYRVDHADLFFGVSDSDAINLLSALTARRMGARKCVARLGNPEHGANPLLLEDSNILPLYPERLVAEEILGITRLPGVSKAHFFENGKLLLLRARPTRRADIYNRPLRELVGPEGWVLVGVEKGMKLTIPRGDTVLRPGQRVYAVGRTETARDFLKAIGIDVPPTRKVIVAGAGHVGSWLAKKLVEDGVQVTLIQREPRRALAVATEVPGALVLQGDATDPSLLKEAGAPDADYYVAATQDDETNVISSYLAREGGARTVVSLYQRPEFVNVLRAARVDIGLSPRLITAGTILRMVHRREILSLDLVASGDAEVVEFQVPESSKVLNGPLRGLKLPEGCIVGAVIRGEERHVPGGDFAFQAGDRALVFSLTEVLPKLEKLFRGR
ncbi:MAG TPA: Trk system potassium transporter TrkA [Vicinamibacteria bacterium]|nr:Trk system potassium transporter TrkA [Vicinamibacteria bacterium]